MESREDMPVVFVSHVRQYTGPGIVEVLTRRGYRVLGHDVTFTDAEQRRHFVEETGQAGIALAGQTPTELAAEIEAQGDALRLVFNDVHPNAPKPFKSIDPEELQAAFGALVVFPFRLCQLLLPTLKRAGRGAVVFVTSARQLQPEPGFAVATSVRAGATALALAVAREAAPHGIQVNALQPNYLYSELYYPRARFVDDPAGREHIARTVPAGRLGQPEEFGELVEFCLSGRSSFTTGQVISFTGGWP